ncbi:MAG: RNA polymerase sigma factor [Turneriella sp.]|nr:RNA polymerase sigma factor [Leptospiraceae bacterium]MCX7632413.1 RNA polymerase sigma factor [Turneriella sp.]
MQHLWAALVSFALKNIPDFMARLLPYRERLYRLALAQLRNPHDAEDAVQDVLIKAGRKASSFRSESSEYTWVVRILINHCHDLLRKKNRRSRREVTGDILQFSATIADPGNRPEQNTELSELSRHLMDAVNGLSAAHKEIILMRYFEEMSYEEIAAVLRLSLGTVKSRLSQAKLELKNLLLARGIREDQLG